MAIYNKGGTSLNTAYSSIGTQLTGVYDIDGSVVFGDASEDYDQYSNEYQHKILQARDEALTELRSGDDVVLQIIHADQHGKLTANNTLFPYLGLAMKWNEVSACIGLGDVSNYSVSAWQAMKTCLSAIPISKQINIWGNHDTWGGSRNLTGNQYVASDEEFQDVLSHYFDNSEYNGNVTFNEYGIQSMIDSANHIKYVVIGGWEYDPNLGGLSHYVIGSDSMDYLIQMLNNTDGNDIVILSHIQPFKNHSAHDDWTVPYEDACGGGGLTEDGSGRPDIVVNRLDTYIDDLIIGRKNKTSGTVDDSYKNSHSFDFSNATGDLLCCFAGHEHCNWYTHQDGDIPIAIFDAYAYDTHPIYFVCINRTEEHISVWRVDETPQYVKWTIPFASN